MSTHPLPATVFKIIIVSTVGEIQYDLTYFCGSRLVVFCVLIDNRVFFLRLADFQEVSFDAFDCRIITSY